MQDRLTNAEIPSRFGAPLDRLKTLGMVVKTEIGLPPRANPFYSQVILGIEEARRRSQINLLFATLPVDEYNLPVEVPKFLANPDAVSMGRAAVQLLMARLKYPHAACVSLILHTTLVERESVTDR